MFFAQAALIPVRQKALRGFHCHTTPCLGQTRVAESQAKDDSTGCQYPRSRQKTVKSKNSILVYPVITPPTNHLLNVNAELRLVLPLPMQGKSWIAERRDGPLDRIEKVAKTVQVTCRFGHRTKRVIIIQADKVGICWTKRSIGYIGIWNGRGPVEGARRWMEIVLVLVLVLVAWQAMSGADEQRAYCTISQSQGRARQI